MALLLAIKENKNNRKEKGDGEGVVM